MHAKQSITVSLPILLFVEEALTHGTNTTSGEEQQSTASPQATFFFPSSFDPPEGTMVAKANEEEDVACQHRFEHRPIESSVDPDNNHKP